jgi:hypothetical protein
MPIVAADLVVRSSANMPEDDTSTAGGAISTTRRPDLVQFSATAALIVQSDGADVRTGVAIYRNAAGEKLSQAFALNGATEVQVAAAAERVLRVTMDSTSGTRTVSVKQGAAGTVRGTIRPNESTVEILFPDSISESGVAIRYSKVFIENTHATIALTTAAIKLIADPTARIRMGIAAAKGDAVTIANRKTAPAGITFVDDNVSQAVPTGSLAAGEEIGVWLEQNLPANDPPNKSTATVEASGATI